MRAIVILSMMVLVFGQKTPSDFKSGFFKFRSYSSALYNIDVFEKSGAGTSQRIMAYGDFNGDSFTDFITVDHGTQTKLSLFIWNDKSANFVLNDLGLAIPGVISNIMPVSWGGTLQLIVQYLDSAQNKVMFKLLERVKDSCSRNSADCKLEISSSIVINLELDPADPYPFLADLIVDDSFRYPSLVYYTGGQRQYISFNRTAGKLNSPVNLSTRLKNNTSLQTSKFTSPHYNSFVDLDGDCRADLVITSLDANGKQQIEIWIYNTQSNDYQYQKTISLANLDKAYTLKGLQMIDLNFDGSVDMALMLDNANSTVILNILNKNSPSSSTNWLCGTYGVNYDTDDLNSQVNNPAFSIQGSIVPDLSKTLTSPVFSFFRMGDFDLDGYPDMTLILQSTTSNQNSILLLSNQDYGQKYQDLTERSQYSILDEVKNPVQVSFFDINENGQMDFFINYLDSQNKLQIGSIYNYFKTDNYFLKCFGLNGYCKDSSCQSSIYYGSTFSCKVTTNDQERRIAKGNQLSQSSYTPLQLPFSIMGLSRTYNYIEKLTIGMPQQQSPNSKQYETTIPNSQLIFYPYSPNVNEWQIDIFIKPNQAVVIVIVVTCILLLILGGIIFYFHRKEKKEDELTAERFIEIFR